MPQIWQKLSENDNHLIAMKPKTLRTSVAKRHKIISEVHISE